MADRYQEVYRIPEKLFIEESPVIIETGVLFKDTVTNKVLVLAKLRNIMDKKIVACKVAIRSFEPNGTELENMPEFTYLDVAAGLGHEFGAKTPVFLPDARARRIMIAVIEVVFDDGSVWKRAACEWLQIPKQKTVADYFANNSLREQYELEVGSNCKFVPEIWNGLFLCTCGTANLSTAGSCYNCHHKYEVLKSKMEYEYLYDQIEKREAEKKALEEVNRQKKEKTRKTVKKATIGVTLIAAIVIVMFILTRWVIIPAVENATAYRKASSLLQDGSYDQAIAAFEALGDYKDSSEMILESKYQKAESFAENQQHKEAIELWTQLGDYADSQQRIDSVNYQDALDLMEQGKYVSAAQIFEKLGDYKDSADLSKKCRELKQEADQNANASQREIDEQNSKKYFAKAGER